ncbi:MAG: RNA polymerase-binding protein DksA [Pseudomonadota bacterium]
MAKKAPPKKPSKPAPRAVSGKPTTAKPQSALKKLANAVVGRAKAALAGRPKPAGKASPAPTAASKAAAKLEPKAITRPGGKAAPKAASKPVPAKPVAKPTAKPAAVAPKPAAKADPVAKPAPALKAATGAKVAPAAKPVSVTAAPSARPAAAARSGAVAVAIAVSKPKTVPRPAPRKAAPIVVAGDERVRPDLPPGYRPSPGEAYMGPLHLEYFRQKLLNWRVELVEESKQTIDNLREEVRDVGDEAERATRETENSLELRTRDRYRKLISKIDKALRRIEDGEYGFCEETGEEIGIERLEARPIATLCLDAQERWEHRQRQMGD